MWRKRGSGADTIFPSYVFSDDGGSSFKNISGDKLNMPISVDEKAHIDSDNKKYYAITDITTDDLAQTYIIIHKYRSSYILMSYNKETQSWQQNTGFPSRAMGVKYKNGKFYAFASGLTVYVRDEVNKN
jgi:hypothetical protein